ncbi:MAG: dihydroxyacetone kinase transcriptional activator DhaS [Eubacterium sp.]
MAQNLSCSEKTKVKMAHALKELMQTNTFEKITVSDITNTCKIHRQTFYYHFQDRYELLDWLIHNELIVPFIDNFNLDNMYDRLYNMFDAMLKDKKFYQNALKINSDDLTRYISRVASEQFTEVIRNLAKQNGIENSDKDAAVIIAEFFGHGISGVVISWAQKGMKETPKEMTDRIEYLVEACQQIATKRK